MIELLAGEWREPLHVYLPACDVYSTNTVILTSLAVAPTTRSMNVIPSAADVNTVPLDSTNSTVGRFTSPPTVFAARQIIVYCCPNTGVPSLDDAVT